MVDVEQKFFSRQELIVNDRELVVARLRAQADAADAKRLAIGNAAARAGRRTPNAGQPGGINDKIAFRSRSIANKIERGSGNLTSVERVSIGGARFPNKSRSEIKADFATGAVRARAQEGLVESRALESSGLSSAEFRALSPLQRDKIIVAQTKRGSAEAKKVAFEITRAALPAERVVGRGLVPTERIDLTDFSRGFTTAGGLFRALQDRPDTFFSLVRRPLAVGVVEPIPASFEDPKVLAERAASFERVRLGKVVGPVDTRPRLLSAFGADVRNIAEDITAKGLGSPLLVSLDIARKASSVVEPGLSLVKNIFGTTLEQTSLSRRGADTLFEQSIIERRGGFSREGLAAQASAFRSGLVSGLTGIVAEPVERTLFAASLVVPGLRGLTTVAQREALVSTAPVAIRTLSDVITAGLTVGFVGPKKDVGTFGGALGEATPFIAPSLVGPTARGVQIFGRIAKPIIIDKVGTLRGGKRVKTLAQRSKESRGLVSRVDTTREARLKRKAVAILRTEINPQGKVIQLQEVGGRVVVSELSGRGARRFRRSQTRSGIGKLVDLGPEEAVVIQRTTLSKRDARRVKQQIAREQSDPNLGNQVLQSISRAEQEAVVLQRPVTTKRIPSPLQETGVGRLRRTTAEQFQSLFIPGRQRFSFVEPPVEQVRGGFRTVQAQRAAFAGLRTSAEQSRLERIRLGEVGLASVTPRLSLLPVSEQKIVVPGVDVSTRLSLAAITDTVLAPVSVSRLQIVPLERGEVKQVSRLDSFSVSVSRLRQGSIFDSSTLLDTRLDSLVEPQGKLAKVFDQPSPLKLVPITRITKPPARPPIDPFRSIELRPRVPFLPRVPRVPTIPRVPKTVPPVLKVPFGLELPDADVFGVPGFRVEVKRRGVFELLSGPALSEESAFVLGARITDESPAQTFRLLETDELVSPDDNRPSRFALAGLLGKFNRKQGNVFRERQASLIDTPGELRDITFKGIAASARSRSQLGRLGL